VDLHIDAQDWDRQADKMIQALGGPNSRYFERAANRAIRKTGRWLRTQVARAVAKDAGIPVTRFRKMRVSLRYDRQQWSASLWVGTNPFPAWRAGKVKWTRRMRGARAGRKQFPGSFSWKPYGGKAPIFRRKTAASDSDVEVVTVELDAAAEEHARRIERRALSRFRVVLQQELNYEMSKRFG